MACGTPVIALEHGSVPEVIEHGVSGFVANSIDEAVSAVRLVSSLERTGIRKQFEHRFTAQRMANDYLAVYRRLPALRQRPQLDVLPSAEAAIRMPIAVGKPPLTPIAASRSDRTQNLYSRERSIDLSQTEAD
jgi:hypothetical protein